MEFDEIKKIWDNQNNEPMYAINEAALHKRIHSYNKRTGWLAHINELGLILISVAVGLFLLIDAVDAKVNLYSYIGAILFFLIGSFVLWSRIQRKKTAISYGKSMLDELDHAISNARYLVNFSKTFVWWFILPAALFVIPNMVIQGAPWYKWLLILASFVLSWLVVRFELNKMHLPRKKKLEALREKLAEETDEGLKIG